MDTFLTILPYLVTILCSVLTGFFTYFLATRKAKSDLLLSYKKAIFEKRLSIFSSLTVKMFDLCTNTSLLYPPGLTIEPADYESQARKYKGIFNSANAAFNDASQFLRSSAPFIDKETFDRSAALIKECLSLVSTFQWEHQKMLNILPALDDSAKSESYVKSEELLAHYDSYIEFLRIKIESFSARL